MHNIHPSLPVCPLYPHKNGFKSGGKFIRSKNKHVSASVLLPCRVPQGCTVLWMSPVFSPCLWSTRAHTHNTYQRTHILSKGHSEAVITSILQLCYRCYPLSSQSSPFLWVRSGENEAQNPAAIKCLLPLPNSSVWTHHSCTIYFICYTQSHTSSNLPQKIYLTELPLCPSGDLSKLKIALFCSRWYLHNKTLSVNGFVQYRGWKHNKYFLTKQRPNDCKYHSLSLHFWSNNTVCLEMNYSHCCIFMFSYSRQNIMYFIKYNGWFSHQLTLGGKVL